MSEETYETRKSYLKDTTDFINFISFRLILYISVSIDVTEQASL